MNTDLALSSKCFGLYDDNNIIGFLAVLHQPHAINKKIKRCTRLVILPDYQGIGLGTKFLSYVAKIYYEEGYDFSIVTSAKNLISSLKKNKNWILIRYGVEKSSKKVNAIDYKRKSMRKSKTASFLYKKENKNG